MTKNLLFTIVITCATIIIGGAGGHGKPAVKGASTGNCQEISGLVLPHHDLARGMIIDSVEKLAAIYPDMMYIAVLSPNHFRPQSETFTTANVLKNFPIATEQIDRIRNAYPALAFDEKLLDGEHGLYIPMATLMHYYPGAKFIPIAVSPYYTAEKLKRMATILSNILPGQTLFVASTDFSHGHMQTEAELYDAQTIDAIKNFDFRKLSGYGNDNLDSPAAMEVIMNVMLARNATVWKTWNESHGAILTGNPQLSGTSYVSGVFTDPSCIR
jgi:AmmeMemoRadiSam system protein B